jgi:hypothetical protein
MRTVVLMFKSTKFVVLRSKKLVLLGSVVDLYARSCLSCWVMNTMTSSNNCRDLNYDLVPTNTNEAHLLEAVFGLLRKYNLSFSPCMHLDSFPYHVIQTYLRKRI